MLKLKYAFLTASLGIFVSCGNVNKSDVQRNLDSKRDSGPIDSTNSISSKPQDTAYLKETSNAISAKSLAAVLQSYLKDDIKTLPAADRSFSFYEIDLNSDKQNEYLIKLPDKGFCGSGGCTFVLADNNFQIVNRFTVTNPPIYVGTAGDSGWKTLILKGKSANKFIHLKWNSQTKKYPSNPSLVAESNEAPTRDAYIMWQDVKKVKTFQF